jgi:hypothetical protein
MNLDLHYENTTTNHNWALGTAFSYRLAVVRDSSVLCSVVTFYHLAKEMSGL